MKTLFIGIMALSSMLGFASKASQNGHRIDAVHTPAQLSKYNLFASDNALIEHVWIVSDNEMRIVLKSAEAVKAGEISILRQEIGRAHV